MPELSETSVIAAEVAAEQPRTVETIIESSIPVALSAFLNVEYGVVGRSVSTKFEPNTSNKFHFWIAQRANQQLHIEIGNIIAAVSDDLRDVTFGTLTEMRSYSDVDSFLADFLSHDFGEPSIQVPTDIAEVVVVTCNTMRNLSGLTRPVGRSRVYFPNVLGIQYSFGMVDRDGELIYAGAPIPIGLFENGDGTTAPISLDEDFVLGPEGAHLNVSGISGLASKTSAVQFGIKSILTHSSKRIAVVMFNVKSKDLLYIDRPNPALNEPENEWSQRAYETLGIPIEPFQNCRFFAPADLTNNPNGTQSKRRLATERFIWDLQLMFESIPALFNPLDWDDKMEGVWYSIRQEIEQGTLLTYARMLAWVQQTIQQANTSRPPNQWPRGSHIATWNKMLNHLSRFPRSYSGLIQTVGNGSDIPWRELNAGSTFVIDIEMLNDRGQKLVFSRAIRRIADLLEAEHPAFDSIVVFVDELNKFAPSGSQKSSIKERLIDITARGRSLGLILFGAEQFASSVDKEVIDNGSTFLYGRTEANELRAPNYSAFSDEIKTKLMTLAQGQLLAKFPKFSQPIFVKFPYPPCIPGNQFEQ